MATYMSGKRADQYIRKFGLHVKDSTCTGSVITNWNGEAETYYYEKAFIAENVFLPDSLFDINKENYYCESLIDSIEPGNESYIILFRNHYAWHLNSAELSRFYILLNIQNKKINVKKSIVVNEEDSGEYFSIDNALHVKEQIILLGNHTSYKKNNRKFFHINISIDSLYTLKDYEKRMDKL